MKSAPLNRSGVDPLVGGRFDDRHRQVGHLRHALKTLSKTRFKKQDWSKGRSKEESYDTIMCLSVTKWIHLNGGDAALKSFFKKVYSSLTPGGLLVLEPQPWRSYRSAIHKQQTCNVPFRRIEQLQLRPDGFLTFLTDKVGFTVVADLNAGNTAHHFDRPLYILQRPYDGNAMLV
ncbi:hypothetical protein CEUSTIGMA_g10890.t1 [Chlamydomonas eustigma]|uniref:RNA methyltransferase n=1 Tax=Chlamydomonas eustigma TaxID=1157962 RepID=A0A250XK51_9CHLO|nr:hypothetical protein CEUSTIGMA_g10890.t1 [Chlamydomonas eustigma]|eukprot:GAX83465.1 hypothetical protein CEUSTIGMA_g10890.t1 [Chlamydomonas eustigma]